jgi:hypothetical protein
MHLRLTEWPSKRWSYHSNGVEKGEVDMITHINYADLIIAEIDGGKMTPQKMCCVG